MHRTYDDKDDSLWGQVYGGLGRLGDSGKVRCTRCGALIPAHLYAAHCMVHCLEKGGRHGRE